MSRAGTLAAVLLAASLVSASRGVATAGDLDLGGVTFVASRGSASELVLLAERVHVGAGVEAADLEEVRIRVPEAEGHVGFELSCRRGRIDLSSNDFHLEGEVEGRDAEGRVFRVEWLAYDESDGLLYSDAAVVVEDASGRYQAGGLRYHIRERRLSLTGGVTVLQGLR